MGESSVPEDAGADEPDPAVTVTVYWSTLVKGESKLLGCV